MAEIHQMILANGVETARKLAFDKTEMQRVDAAFSIMSDDQLSMKILHSGFAMTALPHRNCKENVWERSGGPNGEIKLLVESGLWSDKQPVGIPFGTIARLILIHLCTEAKENNSRFVELGPSMRAFLKRMGLTSGGKTFEMIRDQSRRLSLCRLTFFNKRANNTQIRSGSFVRNAVIIDKGDGHQLSLWNDQVELDEVFYNSLIEHPLPIREAAIKALGARSMAIDLYVYLAYRLHILERPISISWKAFYDQFGAGFSRQRDFVRDVKAPLQLALAVYPEARVETSENGIQLYPSPSPVPKVIPKFAAKKIAAF